MDRRDILIIGGGIAGASLGAETADQANVTIAEAETYCGMHATGRSAAFWLESYGGPVVAELTSASRLFLDRPPGDFADSGFLIPRGAVHVSRTEWAELPGSVATERLGRPELERLVPGLLPNWRFGVLEPGCADIDVAALHAAYLRKIRRSGGEIRTDQRLVSTARRDGRWVATMADGTEFRVDTIVDAAGAWADEVAMACGVKPLGIAPKRRTMVQLRVGRSDVRGLPLVSDSDGNFYFKGEGECRIWLSPHDEIDTDPCDAVPDDVDVAIAIDRFQAVVDWPVEAVEHSWAGLRSFAPDRLPIYGYDPEVPGFFWCAGQGGFGIQTAPAAAKLAASMLLCSEPDPMVSGIHPASFSPDRFR